MKKHQQLEKLLGRELKHRDLIVLANVFGYGNNCHGIDCLFEDVEGGDIQPIGNVSKRDIEKEEKQAELDDLLYSLDLMYKQSQQAKGSVPIHPNRFKLIRNTVGGFYANAWRVWETK
ncbi:hypothetical protein [Pelosinus sp. IPA-1]|uniref:hypothetical protein n=1 Tax=Pelosinus sp. IPA-1 TaxID=3029569 RepID=UPI0024361F8C|nr:hypothetical protein [Pelosinus sp. IPA-1]GMB00082.1 hypothetical protein PIPA1_28810 [Pelosinus sp. IPA-1]